MTRAIRRRQGWALARLEAGKVRYRIVPKGDSD